MIEEDLEDESESESDKNEAHKNPYIDVWFSCEYCKTQFGIKNYFETHMKRHEVVEDYITCLQCSYKCKSSNIFEKHMNMKHAQKSKSSSKTELNDEQDDTRIYSYNDTKDDENKDESDSEEEQLLYQFEDDHGKTVTRKEWTSCEDSDCGICSECNMKKYEDEP